MDTFKRIARVSVMTLVLVAVISLAQISGFSQTAVAEGGGGENPVDSIIAPEPMYQPDGFRLFDALGLLLDAML